jgi:glycosyltransferase involved in cell wall biosynthesis
MTGSGVLVSELWRSGLRANDKHWLICAGYPGDDWAADFGRPCDVITFSCGSDLGQLPFAVPGMSDAMPYPAARYRDLRPDQVREFVEAFRHVSLTAVARFAPDLVHIHHLWVLTALAAYMPVPCCVTVHGTDLRQATSAAMHGHWVLDGIPSVSHVFCVSRDMAAEARSMYQIPAGRVSVLGNGFNDRIFRIDGRSLRRDRGIVLCAGKFVGWKGFVYAVRASAQTDFPHELVILGDGPAQERRAVADEADRLGVRVFMPGHLPQEDVARWMRSAEVFLLSSIREPFGLVLLEAMACGCRVVAAEEGGPRDIISPDLVATGLASLVRPLGPGSAQDEARYVADLAAALDAQLARGCDQETRAAIAASVVSQTWDNVYQTMRSTYERLTESGN